MMQALKMNSIPFELYYAAPSIENCPFYEQLLKDYSNECRFYFSSKGQRMDTSLMDDQPIGTHVYFCGSESMMNVYIEAAKSYGYTNREIHFELFAPPSLGPAKGFLVELARSNKTIAIQSDETLLDGLLKHNIEAPYSCRAGGCGSCQLEVLKGSVDHRDLFLTDVETKQNNCIMSCVSRASGDKLVLNL